MSGKRSGPGGGRIDWQWIGIIAGSLLFIGIAFYLWQILDFYHEVESYFFEEAGLNSRWAGLAAGIGAFIYATLLPSMVVWMVFQRRKLLALAGLVVAYGTLPVASLVLSSDDCFNQRTGEPLKWYAVRPDGEVLLADETGFDQTTGRKRQPATAAICRIVERQKTGIRPQKVSCGPSDREYFDTVTGQAVLWYARNGDGEIECYDSDGFSSAAADGGSTVARALKPVTGEIVAELKAKERQERIRTQRELRLIEEHQARLEEQKRLERERAEALAARQEAERARAEVARVFGVDSYSPGTVVLAANPRGQNAEASAAAKALLQALSAEMRRRGVRSDTLRSAVLETDHFGSLHSGDLSVVREIGLDAKLGGGILSLVDSTCKRSTAVGGVVSCSMEASARVIERNATGSTSITIRETGAGTSVEDAVAAAAERLLERNARIFEFLRR